MFSRCVRIAWKVAGVGALMMSIGLFAATARAGVKPGDVITPQNASQVKDLVSPGVYYMVTHGMQMDIVPSERIDWPPPYKDATEKYSSQVRLTDDHRSLIGYVAGQPFPLIDTNDPQVANKIMWNNVFRPISTDDYDLRFFDCQIEYVNPGHEQKVVNDIQVGHYAGYDLVGRTEVEPLPVDPDFQEDRTPVAVRPVSDSRAAGSTRPGPDSLSLRSAQAGRRYLVVESGQPSRAAPERVAEQHGDRSAELRPRSLFGIQSED